MRKNAATVRPDPLLAFRELPAASDSEVIEVCIARTGTAIGSITWMPQYRQYAFRGTGAYTRAVLQEVSRKLYALMATWRKTHPNPRRGLRGLSHQERKAEAHREA